MVRDVTGKPILEIPEKWSGLPLGLFPLPATEQRGPSHTEHPLLVMVLQGHGRRMYQHGPHTVELTIEPQQMDILGCCYERNGAKWDSDGGLTVGVQFQPDVVSRLIHETSLDIETHFEILNPQVSWLVQTMLDEVRHGAPSGALYAQGLSIGLIGLLRERYGRPLTLDKRGRSGLTPSRMQRVRDLIEAHLGENLCITRLAQEVSLSPVRFTTAFKASFGCTPHRWVQQRRINEAIRQLKVTPRSIADIALSLGFASQSHFTQVFRQLTGTTPACVRQSEFSLTKLDPTDV